MSPKMLPVMLASLLIAPAVATAQEQGSPLPRPVVQRRPGPMETPSVSQAVIVLRDGTRIAGDVVSSAPGYIVVRTPSGLRIVQRNDILRTEAVRREQARKVAQAMGRKVASDLHEPPKRGETRLGLFPLVQTGVTNQISVGVTPLILPHGRAAIFMTGQLHIQQGNGRLYTAGLLHSEWFDHGRFGFAFGSVTKRSERGSATAGLLVPYAQAPGISGRLIFVRLGGGHTVGSAGYRVNGDVIASAHLGLVTTTLGRAADHVAWSAGLMTMVYDGRVRRVAPIFNMGVRF